MSHPRQGPAGWTAAQHEAYLDNRPDLSRAYNPAAEYGDPDWREPASDAEATARTTWLAEHAAPITGWTPRPPTAGEDALEDAAERAVLSDRAHDHDPYAWAEYQRLLGLEGLAPPPAHDALDDLPRDGHGAPDTLAVTNWQHEDQIVRDDPTAGSAFDGRDGGATSGDLAHDHPAEDRDGPFLNTQGRWWPSTGAWAAGTCDPSRAHDSGYLEAPDDPERLRQRIENLRTSRAAQAAGSVPDEDEQRRAQLARWHDEDHRATDTRADLDSLPETDDGGDGLGTAGWGR
ncbi:hypothetical protein Acsp06_54180 [Actinomycetospora sp. NBRC 106375]|uniref:hypothetical protein n=1 Tax=Actinomycetospora sp. NBRC 106375 TaxID=3032207 RepID=UPI0024A463F4|nr:hypothetical protein [Actinomycetospora sp. NBRC 106375]GLZ49233.1 hypothetical protein Acsp06_54180 [Actinomycetospora sp. NBRC 106375]